ncbi:hypothetical protein ACWIGW_46030 [Nocardia brasiliensis]
MSSCSAIHDSAVGWSLCDVAADADRAFIQDILGFAGVDSGGGWLIFKLPPAEIAVHPTEGQQAHEIYLMCDDSTQTLDEAPSIGKRIGLNVGSIADLDGRCLRCAVVTGPCLD